MSRAFRKQHRSNASERREAREKEAWGRKGKQGGPQTAGQLRESLGQANGEPLSTEGLLEESHVKET